MKRFYVFLVISAFIVGCEKDGIPTDKTKPINFADSRTKEICTILWDVNEDGELSYDEAAMVSDIPYYLFKSSTIRYFDEFKYFTKITNIEDLAFCGCHQLERITLPPQLISIGQGAFSHCTSLKAINIPNSVKTIQSATFEGCSSLKEISLSNSITSIAQCTFHECTSLESVVIPATVSQIGEAAFMDCKSITNIFSKATTPPNGNRGMFSYHASNRKIYVPRNSVNAYKSAEYWMEYAKDIVGYDF